ncbi:MAG: (2Fe-2S)-binding protein [Rhodospirillales bacterium]|nr:(2Fe-2S)-binding protein [Rhodospirillales bacterium]
MYVCICNGYREDDVHEAAADGARYAEEVYYALGNGPCCGQCLEHAQEILDAIHGSKGTSSGSP